MTLTLKAETREKGRKAETLRKQGLLPAVFYGRKEESTPITLAEREFGKVWREAGESSVITLALPDREVNVLIHDVAQDPVLDQPMHVDFYAIEADRAVEVAVPIEFEGEAPAVREQGGTLVKVLHELSVEALPQNLPHELSVDISSLSELDSQILAGEVKLPEGVTLKNDPEEVVAAISTQEEESAEEPAEFDASAVEVEEKGKKEEETPEATE